LLLINKNTQDTIKKTITTSVLPSNVIYVKILFNKGVLKDGIIFATM